MKTNPTQCFTKKNEFGFALFGGLQWSRTGNSIEKLEHWMKEWECSDDDEPFVDIYVRYINSETKKYSFEIEIGCCVKYVN